MFLITATAVIGAIAIQAAPDNADTLKAVITHGIVMSLYGMKIPVTYTPDGKFTAQPPGAPVMGDWRIEGEKLCTRTPDSPTETCAVYPAGKGSGDTFVVPGAMGPTLGDISVTIN